MNAIETHALRRLYGRTRAVDGVELIVPQGAAVVLVGANGAGKSTTLQMLMGLTRPSSGSATMLGRDCANLAATDFHRIGYATESQVLPDYMTLQAWFDYLRPLYPTWDAGRETELLARFDLPMDRRIKSLSRGERMKACAAAAMGFRPPLLVMDEPLSGLDPLSREELVRALIEQAEEASLLISSHDLSEIERVATHVAVMHKGKLILQEETDRLTTRFREVTVALNGQAIPAALPGSWINARQENGALGFVETAFGGEAVLRKEVSARLGVESPIVAPMSLAAISGAVMRHAQTKAPEAKAA